MWSFHYRFVFQISPSQPGATTQTIQLPGGQTIQVPLNVTQMSALASSQTDAGGVSTTGGTLTTSTEAIIAAATSAEAAAAAVAQEQGATLVTVHPAVIEAPTDGTEGGHDGEEHDGDGEWELFLQNVYKIQLIQPSLDCSSIAWTESLLI